MSVFQPSVAESLSELWSVLHRQAAFTLPECEVHYLTSIALALDDDLLSHLLLKKLRLAKRVRAEAMADGIVRMNSRVEFSFGEERNRSCRLLHPSSSSLPPDGLSIASLAGAGLIGMSAGQRILWPTDDGKLRSLAVARVANRPVTGANVVAFPGRRIVVPWEPDDPVPPSAA